MRPLKHSSGARQASRPGSRDTPRFRRTARWRVWLGLAVPALLLGPAGCSPRTTARDGASPLRLVSTAPNLTESLFAIGAGELLVGRSDSCDYPPEARSVPAVGGFGTPWLEPLLAARPTHVLESVLADPDLPRRLEALHIPVVHVPCARLDDIPAALLQLGTLTGREARSQSLAADIRTGLAAARAAPPPARRARVALLFAADSPITAGRHAFIAELLRLAGADNVGDGAAADYYRVSLEWLLAQDPDILLCLFETAVREPADLFAAQTGWRALAAVRARRVYTVADLNAVCRPGPRVLEGIAQLRAVLAQDAARASDARLRRPAAHTLNE